MSEKKPAVGDVIGGTIVLVVIIYFWPYISDILSACWEIFCAIPECLRGHK